MDNGKKVPAINPPGGMRPTDPGYLRKCGYALEPSLHRLIELAVEAGWVREDVVAAILVETGRHLQDDGIGFATLDDDHSEERFPGLDSIGRGRLQ